VKVSGGRPPSTTRPIHEAHPASHARQASFDRLRVLLGGYEVTQLLYVLAELRIPDRLADGRLSADELADATSTDPGSLRRVLRALARFGVLVEDESGRFALTSLGGRLREDVPGSLRPLAVSYGRPWRWEAWGRLVESVRTGETAVERAHGVDLYRFLAEHPDAEHDFNDHMNLLAEERGRSVASAYDFSGVRLLVDVGGGQGGFVGSILRAYEGLEAIVFDVPGAVREAEQRLPGAGLAGRVRFEAGDFFVSVPAGGDAYMLSNVVHDWDDEQAVAIVRSCREAMLESARLLIVQELVPIGPERAAVNVSDISLLVLSGGRERTLDEYRELLRAAGFSLEQVVETTVGTSVLEAVPRD
jgi:O-methyltransferase domain/Dimerisation domain